jgi:hypothetical protein
MGPLAAILPAALSIGGSLLGGKKVTGGSEAQSQQSSQNLAYPNVMSEFGGIQPSAREGTGLLNDLLSGNTSGLNMFRDSTGFNSMLQSGNRNIIGSGAASGLLRSGGTGKVLQAFGTGLASQSTQNYIDTLLKKIGVGMDAGKLITAAGQTSSGTSSSGSQPGISGMLGSLFSSIGGG